MSTTVTVIAVVVGVAAVVAALGSAVFSSRARVSSDGLRHDLQRLGALVGQLGESSAQRFGQVDYALRMHADVTGKLAASTSSLREALANPQARGRWGERMAEDVLRLAGFVENVNYRKQVTVAADSDSGSGRPDFVFDLPKGHVLYMDVKFPLASYLRYCDATTEPERAGALTSFLRDVRARVKELADRRYGAGDAEALDYVLLFLPNEQLSGFIHTHDGDLLDEALRRGVVLCSPMTLFALLGVIRQAFDNFVIEQTSDEILQLVGLFNEQWGRYVQSAEKVGRHLDSLQREFDHLTTTRERAVERPLRQLEALREQRAVPVPADMSDASDPPLRVVDRAP